MVQAPFKIAGCSRLMPNRPRFAGIPSPNPADYATAVFPLSPDPKTKVTLWVPHANPNKPFLSWNHLGRSVAHALVVFKNRQNQPFIRFLQQTRPALGGVDTVESVAGKYGDSEPPETEKDGPLPERDNRHDDAGPTETAEAGALRELEEETGLRPRKIMLLSADEEASQLGASIATSGGITNERNAFALILAEDVGRPKHFTENELKQNVRQLDIPLGQFLNPRRFKAWRARLKKSGILMGLSIPALRGLLPGRKVLRQFLELDSGFSAAKN